MNKPNITVKQFNRLMELLDDDCLGKTPFHCADGECSDRFFTRQHNIMWDYFNVVDAPLVAIQFDHTEAD